MKMDDKLNEIFDIEPAMKTEIITRQSDKAKQVTNNNAIFVGSTSELNKLIKNMTKGE